MFGQLILQMSRLPELAAKVDRHRLQERVRPAGQKRGAHPLPLRPARRARAPGAEGACPAHARRAVAAKHRCAQVHLQYVRGHVGEEGNEGADRLANMGALRPEAPERDWEALERHVCGRVRAGMGSADPKTMPSVSASAPVDDLDLEVSVCWLAAPGSGQHPVAAPMWGVADPDLQAYADCLLSPEELEMEMMDDDL